MGTKKVKLLESKKNKNAIFNQSFPSSNLSKKTSKRKKKHLSSKKSVLDDVKKGFEISIMEELKTQLTVDDFTTSSVNEAHKITKKKKKKSLTSHRIKSEKPEDVGKGVELSSQEGEVETHVAMGQFTEISAVSEAKKVSRKKKRSRETNENNKSDNSTGEVNSNKSMKNDPSKGKKKRSRETNTNNKSDKSTGEVNLNKSIEDDPSKREKSNKFHTGMEETTETANAELVDEIQDVDIDCFKGMTNLSGKNSKRKKKHQSSRKSVLDDVNKGDEISIMEEVKTQLTVNDLTISSVNEAHKITKKKKKKSLTSHRIKSEKSEDVGKGVELSSREGEVETHVTMGQFTEISAVSEAKKVSRKKKRSRETNENNKSDNSTGEVNSNKSTKNDPSKGKKKRSRETNRNNKSDKSTGEVNLNKLIEDCLFTREKSNKFHTGIEAISETANAELVDEIQDVDIDCSKGMKKWLNQYWNRRPGLKILQDNIDQFLMAHEAAEEKARKEREALAEEGGWTVVVHHKGRKKTTDAESGVAVSSIAQAAVMENLAKKKKKEIPLDFYRFQKREARRNEVMQLQSKFEQEKKRIQQLRAARKFRPY